MKYLVLILFVAALFACKKPKGNVDAPVQDSTAVVQDSIVSDSTKSND